ncbi:heavy-metal-associated domain-containing protein [Afifella pfennigii]|uniref:heavy-metal-associated domain-containing protein n=1 Tax=Afifella pfennigii TaxID=209897 RepID=UPI000478CE36|nr:heavy-metal-associated domain-containing protein [Afifella pfennigii]
MLFHIEKMACRGCVESVSEAIRSLDGAAKIVADLQARTVEVQSDMPRQVIETVLKKAGYPAQPVA